jgi:hypothetical protein
MVADVLKDHSDCLTLKVKAVIIIHNISNWLAFNIAQYSRKLV